METANIKIAINGDNNNILYKRNVTPPEVIVLRAMHGQDSIREIQLHPINDKRSHDEEFARLESVYGGARDQSGKSLFSSIFPSRFNIQFPVTFKKVGFTKEEMRDVPDLDKEKKPGYKEVPLKRGFVFDGTREDSTEEDEDEESTDNTNDYSKLEPVLAKK